MAGAVLFSFFMTPGGFHTSCPPGVGRYDRPYRDHRCRPEGRRMEEQWYAARSQLRALLQAHPRWSNPELAAQLGCSVGWVKKWKGRLRAAPPDDDTVLRGHSRARKHPPAAIARVVVDRILAIRDQPPANLRRVPGPKAILYYLGQDPELAASGARLPR